MKSLMMLVVLGVVLGTSVFSAVAVSACIVFCSELNDIHVLNVLLIVDGRYTSWCCESLVASLPCDVVGTCLQVASHCVGVERSLEFLLAISLEQVFHTPA